MDKTLNKSIYKFYFAGFLLITILPLLSIPPLLHPASWAKTILFRIIISAMAFLAIYQIFFSDKRLLETFKSKFRTLAPLMLLAAIYILSTLFSADPHFSFWGNPARGLGSATLILLIFYSILIFLTLKEKHWQIFWDSGIITGILVSIVAIIQKFEIFPGIINPQKYQAFSTMGGPTILGIYLMLLTFPALSFAFNALARKNNIKSIFYFGSIALFIFGILASAARSAILGLTAGFIFFLFFFPRKTKRVMILKIIFAVIVILAIAGAFWLKNAPNLTKKIEKIPALGTSFYRIWGNVEPLLDLKQITFEKIVSQGRYSGWQILWPALKDHPVLGYGPENQSIAFDKYYNPSIPGVSNFIGDSGSSGWWDRAHNIFLDMGITIGIPGLIIYLLIFVILFLKLRRIKKEKPLPVAGIQSAFIAYFVAVFFNFDSFSTYLIIFSLIGYALFLLKKEPVPVKETQTKNTESSLWKYLAVTAVLFVLLWFIWTNGLALFINKQLNETEIAINSDIRNCEKVFPVLDKIVSQHSFINNYARLKYVNEIALCIDYYPDKTLELSKKAVSLLEEAKKLRPSYTRTWTYSAIFLNKIAESDTILTQEKKQELLNQAVADLEKSEQLSPKRIDLYLSWVKTYLFMQDYKKAMEKADQCIKINPDIGDCYWAKGLSLIATGEDKSSQSIEYITTAIQKGYSKDAYISLSQLIKVYQNLASKTNDKRYYEILKILYVEKIKFDETKFQDHATLAYIYATLGEYDKAREEAAIVLKLSPESEESVKAFLNTLPK